MGQDFIRQKICDGVMFNAITDPKFKTNRLSVNLITPLNRQTVTGYALLPFLLRKGTRTCPDFTALNRKLNQLYGAYLGADVSKTGDSQIITLFIQSLDDRYALENEPVSAECARLLCRLAMDPNFVDGAFPEADVTLEKQNLSDIIASEINDKRTYAIGEMLARMYENEPYGLKKYGYLEDIAAVTPKSAADAYRRLLETAAVELFFVGGGSFEDSFAVAKEYFAVHPRKGEIYRSDFGLSPEKVREFTETMDVAQAKMVLGFRVNAAPGSEDRNPLRLMAALYGGTEHSLLFLNVREKLGLCYYCAARYDRHKGVMLVDSGVELPNIEKAKAEILRQFDRVQSGDFTGDDLNAAKLSLINAFGSVGDSLSSLETYYFGQVFAGAADPPQVQAEQLAAVTKEEIVRVSKLVRLDTVYILKGNQSAPKEEAAHE